MTRLFNKESVVYPDITKAFVTGNFSESVIDHLKTFDTENCVSKLPKNVVAITLTPQIMSLEQEKLIHLFKALPPHVKEINFKFADLNDRHLATFKGLMANAGYAKGVSTVNLQWDFERFPLQRLQSALLAGNLRRLENFNIDRNGSFGVANVSHQDLAAFKEAKGLKNTNVNFGHYQLRQRCRA